jgi:hypothetical protein
VWLMAQLREWVMESEGDLAEKLQCGASVETNVKRCVRDLCQ